MSLRNWNSDSSIAKACLSHDTEAEVARDVKFELAKSKKGSPGYEEWKRKYEEAWARRRGTKVSEETIKPAVATEPPPAPAPTPKPEAAPLPKEESVIPATAPSPAPTPVVKPAKGKKMRPSNFDTPKNPNYVPNSREVRLARLARRGNQEAVAQLMADIDPMLVGLSKGDVVHERYSEDDALADARRFALEATKYYTGSLGPWKGVAKKAVYKALYDKSMEARSFLAGSGFQSRKVRQYRLAADSLMQEGKDASVANIAEHTGDTVEQVSRVMEKVTDISSIDAPIESHGSRGEDSPTSFGEFVADPTDDVESKVEQSMVADVLHEALNTLTPLERTVLSLSSGHSNGKTYSSREIGSALVEMGVLTPDQEEAKKVGKPIQPISHTGAKGVLERAIKKMQAKLKGVELDMQLDKSMREDQDVLAPLNHKALTYFNRVAQLLLKND